ncbi:MAG: copper resistance D family protein [Steroidobacteraceae bacterium]
MPDILSVVLRAVSFVLQLQAAGVVFFAAAFGPALTISLTGVRTLARVTAIVALFTVAGHYVLEAARMAGDMSGMLDGSLQSVAWTSTSGGAFAVRELGLLLIIAGMQTAPPRLTASRFFTSSTALSSAFGVKRLAARGFTVVGVTGAVLVAASFALTGHTATNTRRWLLAPLLLAHLLIVAFWFGALWPLCLVTLTESRERMARVVALFSAAAFWLVPVILVAGVAMAALLLPDIAALAQPYGELVIAKATLFAVLLGLASFNKWRFAPALGRADLLAGRSFRRVVIAEYVIIVVVLSVTAVMTTFFSPE